MDNYAYQPEDTSKPFVLTRYPENHEYLVEVNTRSKLFKKRKFYRNLSVIFIVSSLILLILLLTIGAFYFRQQSFWRLCTTDECLRSAANLRYSIDFNADPCDDFYKYTCGHWSEEHPNHGWFPSYSTFATINERILIHTEAFLTSESTDDPLPLQQSRDFYQSCMDTDSLDELGFTALFAYLKEAELPLIPHFFTLTNDEIALFQFNWLRADAVIKKVFAMDVFIGFIVDDNAFNRSENVMYLGTPGQKCPLPSPLRHLKNDVTLELLKKITNERIMKFVLGAIVQNVTGKDANVELVQEATDILLNMTKFVDELIENYTSTDVYIGKPTSIADYQRRTNEVLLNNINKDYPGFLEKYLDAMFEGENVTIDQTKDVVYISDFEYDYLPKIVTYVLTTSDIYLELYMWWMTVFAMIMNTSTDIVEFISRQIEPFYGDQVAFRPRSIECSSLVNNFMGLAVSYGIADRFFLNQTKPKVEQMLYDIKYAFMERVNSITWMDSKTKLATLEKSNEMISFIGYPDWLFNKGALETYYNGLVVNPDTFLGNMMEIIKDYATSKLGELRKTNERDWRTDPTTVNAFNSFSDNAINVPMAILTYPIYNLGLEALNYGAIGSVLGHELTHGFDNTGRKHDKFGNYKQWWTNETIETFEEKTECFIKQYDNFTIEEIGKRVQGKRTLGENLADNGGLGHAFVAYKNYIRKFGHELQLPGFQNFSHNQLFFIAFGSIWCESASLDELEIQIEYDEHCPNSIRVLGTLQNSPEFAEAFDCPLGSNMNPRKEKCKIW